MNWKSKLKLKYTKEEAYCGGHMAAVLHCSWRGFLLMRKAVETRKVDFDFDHCKLLLCNWFEEYVINYDDLTTRQKRRLEDLPFAGEEWQDKFLKYYSHGYYVNSEFLEYAKIKTIRIRVNCIKGERNGWNIVQKSVICELL